MQSTPQSYLDRSVVHSARVWAALPQLLGEDRVQRRWCGLGNATQSLHHEILWSYITTGRPPASAGLDPMLLEDLHRRDLIVLADGNISAAYPFSSHSTPHSVTIGGRLVFCVCAIDAMGVGAMLDRAVSVRLTCARCLRPISVDVASGGLGVAHATPDTSVIWAGIVAINSCAATSQCLSMLAFCERAHLAGWQGDDATRCQGFEFSLDEAAQAGAAIFRPFLPQNEAEISR